MQLRTDPQEWCQYRYLLYLESGAWATKYKELLACGGVVFSPPVTYPDFFLRALTPGVDYIELAAKDSCIDMLGAPATPPDLTLGEVAASHSDRLRTWVGSVLWLSDSCSQRRAREQAFRKPVS